MFWDTTNYFQTNKQHFLGLKQLSLWLSLWSHLTHHVKLLSHTLQLWKSPPDYWKKSRMTAPTRVHLWGASTEEKKAECQLALNQHTSTSTSLRFIVRCLSGWQGCLSSIHISTVTDCCQDVSAVYRRQKRACLTHYYLTISVSLPSLTNIQGKPKQLLHVRDESLSLDRDTSVTDVSSILRFTLISDILVCHMQHL